MGIKVEVVSDSERARKDLQKLNEAIGKIKTSASNLKFKTISNKDTLALANSTKSMGAAAAASTKVNRSLGDTVGATTAAGRSLSGLNSNYARLLSTSTQLADSQKKVASNFEATTTHANRAQAAVGGVTNKMQGFVKAAAASFVAATGGTAYVRMADSTTQLTTRLKINTNTQTEFNAALLDTRKIALGTRSDIKSVTDLYSKLLLSTSGFANSQAEVAVVTQNVAKAVALSGSSAESASAAVMQLGQAFGSGLLAGDELKSISENAPVLVRAIADGMGVAQGQLKKLGAAGLITSEQLFDALLSQTDSLDGKFKRMGTTFGGAFTNVGNATIILFTEVEKLFSKEGQGGLPAFINNIAVSIAEFANRLSFIVYDFSSQATFAIYKIKSFLRQPLQVQFEALALKVSDILPSVPDLKAHLMSALSSVPKAFVSAIAELSGLSNGSVLHKARGGIISGPGTGRSDSIPAMLSNGEFVINERATRKHRGLLEKINSGGEVAHFADGGAVSTGSLTTVGKYAVGAGSLLPLFGFKKLAAAIAGLGALLIVSNDKLSEIANTKVKAIGGLSLNEVLSDVIGFLKKVFETANNAVKAAIKPVTTTLGKGVDFVSEKSPLFRQVKDSFLSITRLGPYTGGGPFRKLPDERRSVMHDVVNLIPVDKQIPALAAVTAVAGAAIMAVTSAGVFRSTLLGLLTTGLGLAINNSVYTAEIARFTEKLSKSGVDAVQSVVKALFGSGLFGERGFGGTLLLIAKLALLFKSGRELVGGGILKAAVAPTAIGAGISTAVQSKVADRMLANREAKLATITSAFTKATETRADALKALADARVGGAAVGKAQAERIAKGTASLPSTAPLALRMLGADARIASASLKSLNDAQGKNLATVTKNTEYMRKQADTLRTTVATNAENARAGIIGAAGGIGGIFGMLGGFNLGQQLAESIEGLTDWQKIGVTMGTAFLGQAVGAGFTSGLTSGILAIGASLTGYITRGIGLAIGGIATALGVPAIAFAAVVVGGFAAAFAIWSNFEWFEDAFTKWSALGRSWVIELENFMGEFFGMKNTKEKTALKKTLAEDAAPLQQLREKVAGPLSASDRRAADAEIKIREEKMAADRKALEALGGPVGQRSLERGDPFINGLIAKAKSETTPEAMAIQAAADEAQWARTSQILAETPGKILGLFQAPKKEIPGVDLSGEISKSIDGLGDKLVAFGNGLTSLFVAPVKKADGGFVSGPGTGTSDSIPALLSNGEFVINAKAAAANRGLLHSINAGAVPRFAKGGVVGANATMTKSFSEESERLRAAGFYESANSEAVDPAELLFWSKIKAAGGRVTLGAARYLKSGNLARVFAGGVVGANMIGPAIDVVNGLEATNNKERDIGKSLLNFGLTAGGALLFAELLAAAGLATIGAVPTAVAALAAGTGYGIYSAITGKNLGDVVKSLSDYFRAAPTAPVKKANGGFISGPGTGTSDSIPAMLSNGEFVINARDSAKNASLLHAINNGKSVSYFAGGNTEPGPQILSDSVRAAIAGRMQPVKGSVTLEANELITAIEAAAKEFGISADSLKRIMMVESGGRLARGANRTGAVGAGQLMPATAAELGARLKAQGKDIGLVVSKEWLEWQDGLIKFAKSEKARLGKGFTQTQASEAYIETHPQPSSAGDTRFDPLTNIRATAALLKETQNVAGDNIDKLYIAHNAGMSGLVKALANNPVNKGLEGSKLLKEGVIDPSIGLHDETQKALLQLETVTAKSLDEAVTGWGSVTIAATTAGAAAAKHLKKVGEIDFESIMGGKFLEKIFAHLPEGLQKIIKAWFAKQEDALKLGDPLGNTLQEKAANVSRATGREYTSSDIASLSRAGEQKLRDAMGVFQRQGPHDEIEAQFQYQEIQEAATTIEGLLKPYRDLTALLKGKTTEQGLELLADRLTQLGVSVHSTELNGMGGQQLDDLLTILKHAGEAQEALKTATGLDRRPLEARLQDSKDQADKLISTYRKSPTKYKGEPVDEKAKAAGENFAADLQSAFTQGMSSVLKGQKTVKDFIKDLVISFASNVIDTFTKSFAEALFSSSDLKNILESVGASMFGAGESSGGEQKAGGLIQRLISRFNPPVNTPAQNFRVSELRSQSTPYEASHRDFRVSEMESQNMAASPSDDIISTLTGGNTLLEKALTDSTSVNQLGFAQLGEIFTTKIGDMGSLVLKVMSSIGGGGGSGGSNIFGSIFSSVVGAFTGGASDAGVGGVSRILKGGSGGFAKGGPIAGRGTGTSDSILSWLSNGEFVVNAKAARANQGLLTMINSGALPRYAAGGPVGDIGTLPSLAMVPKSQSQQNSVFNINVTGDISRQTRSEIQQMIPQIAGGVNAHNYEKGNRR